MSAMSDDSAMGRKYRSRGPSSTDWRLAACRLARAFLLTSSCLVGFLVAFVLRVRGLEGRDPSDWDGEWRIFARSASDSKGPIAQFLAALDVVADAGVEPDFHMKVIVDAEEEMGRIRELRSDLIDVALAKKAGQ